jgi:GT2 family glycosyltransferase
MPPDTDLRTPTFSVVVPTYQRPVQLERCLRGLAALDYPRHAFEVIVVNDGGSPKSAAVVDAFSGRLPVQCLSQPRSGPARARNAGAARARGTYLAFTDDDCVPAADWLTQLEVDLVRERRRAVGGLTVNALPGVLYSTASQLLVDYLYQYFRSRHRDTRFFTSNNVAFPAELFRQVGGFDESFPLAAAEDREFCERWTRHGLQLVYAEEAVVHHWHHMDLRRFLRQHFNYGRGADVLQRSRAKYDGPKSGLKLEPPSFYFNLVRFPLTRGLGWRGLPLTWLMCLSQAAYATGYAFERLARVQQVSRPRP